MNSLPTSSSFTKPHNYIAAITVAVRTAFQILSTTLLSLLVPLSFLLLARLSTAHYLLAVSDNYPTPEPLPLLSSLFLHAKKPTILHLLVSLITVSSLTHALTGRITLFHDHHRPLTPPRLIGAWIFLCLLQICVGLGLEGSIVSGIDGSGFGQDSDFLGRILFFFGLHETVMFWGAAVVRPVVDDTVFGNCCWGRKGVTEKVAVGLSYGGLWWWRVREEVESLVMVPELKLELGLGIGAADFLGWWLYYLTVTIGVVRVVRGLGLTVVILTRRRRDRMAEGDGRPASVDGKV